MISKKRIDELLSYDEETGEFTWFQLRGNRRNPAGYQDKQGYIRIRIDNIYYAAHRLVWFYKTGAWPVDQIDHKNRERDDNRFSNLREADNQLNCQNRTLSKRSKTGCKGVHLSPYYDDRWIATISRDGRLCHLGTFYVLDEAIAARKQAEIDEGYIDAV